MSRSTRRPYTAVTGTKSAKDDKRLAHRGMRQAERRALQQVLDYDVLLMPKRPEASWNNTWCWGRDGSQSLQLPPDRNRYRSGWYATQPLEKTEQWYQEELRYYRRLHRK